MTKATPAGISKKLIPRKKYFLFSNFFSFQSVITTKLKTDIFSSVSPDIFHMVLSVTRSFIRYISRLMIINNCSLKEVLPGNLFTTSHKFVDLKKPGYSLPDIYSLKNGVQFHFIFF